MEIERIEFENFGSFYGCHRFSLGKRGLVLVHGQNLDEPRMDSNGAGKSTLFDALDWCLFGKVPRGDHVDSVVNEEALAEKGGCRVRVELRDDRGEGLVVERSRGKTSALCVWHAGEELTQLDTDETQERLERCLGLDRELFHAAVLFGQGDLVHYAEATEARRLEILTQILQLEALDTHLERVKGFRAEALSLQSEGERVCAQLSGMIRSLQDVDFFAQRTSWEQARQARVQGLQARLAEKLQLGPEGGGEEIQRGIQTLRQHIEAVRARRAALPLPDRAPLEEAKRALDAALVELRVAERDFTREGQPLMGFDLLGQKGQCPTCQQAVPPEHLGRLREECLSRQRVAAQRVEQAKSAHAQWVPHLAQHEAAYARVVQGYEQVCRGLDSEIQEAQRALGAREAQLTAWQMARHEIAELEQAIHREQTDPNPIEAAEREHLQKIAKITAELQETERALEASKESVRYLDFWVRAFGPEGLKSYILDSRQGELTQAANHWVRLLTGGTFSVQFATQKQTRGKKLVNAPDVRIFRANPDGTVTERNFRSWSGGEKQRISFALDFGLSRLVAQRARCRYDLLILDEVFRHLDRAGKEAVVEMLTELAREKSSVFVVEHDVDFQSQFENQVAIRRKNRRSSIEEGSHVIQEVEARAATPAGLPAGDLGYSQPRRRPVRYPVTGL